MLITNLRCVGCDSANIEITAIKIEEFSVGQEYGCNDCQTVWMTHYYPAGYRSMIDKAELVSLRMQSEAWLKIFEACQKNGMNMARSNDNATGTVLKFIDDMAKRAKLLDADTDALVLMNSRSEAWLEVFDLCAKLGMVVAGRKENGLECVLSFIHSLAEKKGE